jgi:hypothetical protein
MWCKVCSCIDKKDKLFTPKLDTLEACWLPKGEGCYFWSDSWDVFLQLRFLHCQNEKTYNGKNAKAIVTLLHYYGVEEKNNLVCSIILHIMMHGRPMLEYKPMKELFMLLKVKNNPFKHWLDTNGWGIAKAAHDVVIFKTKCIIAKVDCFVINVKNVTTINNQQWINVHICHLSNEKLKLHSNFAYP